MEPWKPVKCLNLELAVLVGHDEVEEEPGEVEPRRRNRWHWEDEGDDGARRHGNADRS